MFHRNIKSALTYYFRSIYLTFDDSVKSQIDLGYRYDIKVALYNKTASLIFRLAVD